MLADVFEIEISLRSSAKRSGAGFGTSRPAAAVGGSLRWPDFESQAEDPKTATNSTVPTLLFIGASIRMDPVARDHYFPALDHLPARKG